MEARLLLERELKNIIRKRDTLREIMRVNQEEFDKFTRRIANFDIDIKTLMDAEKER